MKITQISLLLATALFAACASGGGGSGTKVPEGNTPITAVTLADQTIVSFDITNQARGTVNRHDRTVKLYVPAATNLATLAPTIALKSGYTISPASAAVTDFSASGTTPVTYTVTKTSNGSTTTYAVQAFNAAPDAATVNGWLGRGINLGNDLDAHTDEGLTDDEGAWTGGVKAQEYFFDDYLALGFNSVRVPITWGMAKDSSLRLSDNGASSTVNSTFMTRVDTVASWGIDRGLAVVINAHHEDWIRTMHGTALTAVLPRFEKLWTEIAAHFKYWPPQLVFEILNEPHTPEATANNPSPIPVTQDDVNTINSAILSIIRASGGNNATRAVIIGGYSWNAVTSLNNDLDVPADSYLIANFHDYNPWTFAGMSQGTWNAAANGATMEAELDGAISWAHNKLPGNKDIPLYMGEFGVTHVYNGTKTDAVSRVAWYTKMAALAAAKGIASAAWDDYGDFKMYDRVGRSFETATKSALLGN